MKLLMVKLLLEDPSINVVHLERITWSLKLITFHVFEQHTLKIAYNCKTLRLQKLDMLTKTKKFTETMFFTFKEIIWSCRAISDVFYKRSFNRIINDLL